MIVSALSLGLDIRAEVKQRHRARRRVIILEVVGEMTFKVRAAFAPLVLYSSNTATRDVAQPGSAPRWGCGGRRFKSCRPDHFW